MKKYIIILIMCCCFSTAFAQERVSGTVVDASGLPVYGATVIQKGTRQGVAVDENGRFSFLLKSGEQVLEVSMLGYKTQVVDVKTQKENLRVVLSEDAVFMEEVVVVGFGEQKKVSVTGAIANIGNAELKNTPTSSVTNALTGRIPGLVTRQESGRPGGDAATMFIRGRASLNNTSPLVMVDGVERDMSQIDVEDIAVVSVLKDASATAVYGVRGANGVVLITTKRGEDGKAKISFSAEAGITSYIRVQEVLDANTTALFAREGLVNDRLNPSDLNNSDNCGISEYDRYLYRSQERPFTHPDNNWLDIFTKNGSQQKYNVNVSGGTDKVKYYVSVGYFTQAGMFQTDINKIREHPTVKRLIELSPAVDKALAPKEYDPSYFYRRLTARSNVDIQVTKDFNVKIDLSYRFGKRNRPGTYDGLDSNAENMRLFGMFYRLAPYRFPIIHENGSMASNTGAWRQNPAVTLAYTGFRSDYSNDMETSFSFNYNMRKLVKGLRLTGQFSYDTDWSSWWGVRTQPAVYQNNGDGTYSAGLQAQLPSHGSGKTAAAYKKYGELALRYNKSFNQKHNVSAVALATYTSNSAPISGKYTYVAHVYQALIGRVNYDYDNRYLVEFNVGYNGSNRFAKGHQYQAFPAASVGWVLTNEPYYQKNKILSFAKLRGSFGKVGNDKLGSFSYYYLSEYVGGQSYGFGGSSFNSVGAGLLEGSMANPNVTWEKSTKYNVGIDTKWFNNHLSLSADMFKEHRTDILIAPEKKIISAGIAKKAENGAIVDNKGFEIEAEYSNRVGKVDYFLKGIYSYARNKVIERMENNKDYPYLYESGNPIGQHIGYVWDGFFTSYEEIASSPQQFGLTNLQPGDMKYKDINQDGLVDQNDQMPIKYSPIPEITYSLHAGIAWKGLDISVLFQGAAHGSVYLTGDVAWDHAAGNYYQEHLNRWTPETAATATYPRFGLKADGNHQNYYKSDYWLHDGDYLRLKNAQIGYTLPKKWFTKLKISKVRVYANGYNLYTWDSLKKVDPESPAGTNGYFYPQQKNINFGANVTF